jgi:hypothetical protein
MTQTGHPRECTGNGFTSASVPTGGSGSESGRRRFGETIACSQLKRVNPTEEWLWHGFIERNAVVMLSALWKAGKTTMLSHLLKPFEGGGYFLGKKVEQAKILYVTEEHQNRWAKRRDNLGLGDWIHSASGPSRPSPAGPTGTNSSTTCVPRFGKTNLPSSCWIPSATSGRSSTRTTPAK